MLIHRCSRLGVGERIGDHRRGLLGDQLARLQVGPDHRVLLVDPTAETTKASSSAASMT